MTWPSIEYNKKPGKPSVVKVVKDPSIQRDDIYKSGTIHTGPGEPPSSVSRPTPRSKQVASKPITKGKLLRPGGPGGGASKLAPRPVASRPIPQPVPQATSQSHSIANQQRIVPQARLVPQPRPIPQPTISQPAISQPDATLNSISHSRNTSSSSTTRTVPPPPPPSTPARPQKVNYKALYDFAGQSQNELTLQKDEIVEIIQKESNGMWSSQQLLQSCSILMSSIQAGGFQRSWMGRSRAGLRQHIWWKTLLSLYHPRLLRWPSGTCLHRPQ